VIGSIHCSITPRGRGRWLYRERKRRRTSL
jgi:hypothetical protein